MLSFIVLKEELDHPQRTKGCSFVATCMIEKQDGCVINTDFIRGGRVSPGCSWIDSCESISHIKSVSRGSYLDGEFHLFTQHRHNFNPPKCRSSKYFADQLRAPRHHIESWSSSYRYWRIDVEDHFVRTVRVILL